MQTHIYSAHSQLPAGSDIYENYKYLSLIVVIDVDNGEIVDCVVPTYCEISNQFVCNILRGRRLEELESIIKDISKRFHVMSKRSLITALQMVYNRYKMQQEQI